jgi:type IV pilus assembly protein PilB
MAGDDDVERLGDLLIEEGIITHEEATDSLKASGQANTVLGKLLIQSNPVRRKELASFLAMDAEVPVLDLDKIDIAPHDPPFIPEGIARKHECVPLDRIQNILIVAKANVMNRAAVIDIRKMTGLKVKVFRADEDKVLAALDKVYKTPSRKPAEPIARKPVAAVRAGETPAPAGPLQAISIRADEAAKLSSGDNAEVQKIVAAWEKMYTSAHPIPAERVA